MQGYLPKIWLQWHSFPIARLIFKRFILICAFQSVSSQIEDLSQQVHKAAAEKFKVPLDPSPLPSDITPSLTIKEESEEEEEV